MPSYEEIKLSSMDICSVVNENPSGATGWVVVTLSVPPTVVRVVVVVGGAVSEVAGGEMWVLLWERGGGALPTQLDNSIHKIGATKKRKRFIIILYRGLFFYDISILRVSSYTVNKKRCFAFCLSSHVR